MVCSLEGHKLSVFIGERGGVGGVVFTQCTLHQLLQLQRMKLMIYSL